MGVFYRNGDRRRRFLLLWYGGITTTTACLSPLWDDANRIAFLGGAATTAWLKGDGCLFVTHSILRYDYELQGEQSSKGGTLALTTHIARSKVEYRT